MSIKVDFLFSQLVRFPDDRGDVSDEQGERFHQDIKVAEEQYQGNYMFNVNNRNTRTSCEICSKLTIKIPKRRH